MTIAVYSYTIYHSPNAYLGTVLLRRGLAAVPGAVLVRRPIFVPRERGVLIAEMLGGKENSLVLHATPDAAVANRGAMALRPRSRPRTGTSPARPLRAALMQSIGLFRGGGLDRLRLSASGRA
jgi:hypothetical protein